MNTSILLFSLLAMQEPRIPPLATIVDVNNNKWTLGPDNVECRVVLRNDIDTKGCGSVILIWEKNIFVLGQGGIWWKWINPGWETVGGRDPSDMKSSFKLSWTMKDTTVAYINLGSFNYYVDGVKQETEIKPACIQKEKDVICSNPLPMLRAGSRKISITFVITAIESSESVPFTTSIAPILVPNDVKIEGK